MSVSVSLLGAQYTAGLQFWYSQPSISGVTLSATQRQLLGYGGYLMATWSVADRVFPHVPVPVQGITSKVAAPVSLAAPNSVPAENVPGATTSFALGIGGG